MQTGINWRIGCSGFSYKDWKPVFYPADLPTAKWLNFYSEHFNTLESNVTFYRTPRLSTLQKWFADTPDDFVFSVKAPRLITHYKKMGDTKALLAEFYDLMLKGLRQKLGAILFQFPPAFTYSAERLRDLINKIDHSFTNVLEFRNTGWWRQEVYDAFKENNLTFCSISHPSLPDDIICTSPTIYMRFHGVPELYKSAYSQEYLDKVFHQLNQCKDVKNIYLYFNNTIAATAIENVNAVYSLVFQVNYQQP